LKGGRNAYRAATSRGAKTPLRVPGFPYEIHIGNEATDQEPRDLLLRVFRSIKAAEIKDKGYPKYYLSLLVTLIRSSAFGLALYDDKLRIWRGLPLVAYHLLELERFRKSFRSLGDFEMIPLVLLNEILTSVSVRRKLAVCRLGTKNKRHLVGNDLLPTGLVDSSPPSDATIAQSPSFMSDADFAESNLILLRNTERHAIEQIASLKSARSRIEMRRIPTFVLSEEHKQLVEIELAAGFLGR